ncbi:MAG: cupin domain-containing protein [Polyangiaceae bacterium]
MPHVSRGPLSRFGELFAIEEIRSIERLLRVFGSPVSLWVPDAKAVGGKKVSPRPLDARRALDAYKRGGTLYLNHVEEWVPPLRRITQVLANGLGLPPDRIFCSVLASRAGAGASAHFDPLQSFNIQLRGRKRWRLAPNAFVKDPTVGWAVGHEVSPELATHFRGGQKGMPAKARSVEVGPGDVVFVPRSVWHTTRALDDSLAFCFEVFPQTWADVALAKLRQLLVADERWRAFATGVPPERELLASLAKQARAVSLAPPRLESARRFRKARGVSLAVQRRGSRHALEITRGGRRETALLDAQLVPLCERIAAAARFTVGALARSLEHALTEEEVSDALEWFVEAGILREEA